jgi:hybrid cluster-associated redox disulfide protein
MITKEMHIADILRLYPQTVKVFERFNLECFECQIADFEALEHGATVHKLRIDDLLAELNRTISG